MSSDEPLDGRDQRLERKRLGQVAGDAELGQPLGLTVVALAITTGGEPGSRERRAAEQVPAGVAGQVEVEQDERRPQAAIERAAASSADVRLDDANPWPGGGGRRSAGGSRRPRRAAPALVPVAHRRPLDGDVEPGLVGAPERDEPTPASAATRARGSRSSSPKRSPATDDAGRAAGGDQRDRLAG